MESIQLLSDSVLIEKLVVHRREVVDFLAAVPEDERAELARQAFEVGVFCLERARGAQDLEFVRRHVEQLLGKVEKAVATIPGLTQEKLLLAVGSGDGQVLAPISSLIQQVEKSTQQQLRDVRELVANEIDPSKDSSGVGKALKKLSDLFDPERKDSVQARVAETIQSISAADGHLASSVRAAVDAAVKPLAEEVNRLTHIVTGNEAAAAVLAQTVAKGLTFEELVVVRLQEWGSQAGVEIEHCGIDNQPGDILLTVGPASVVGSGVKIVVECKNEVSPSGRKPINDAATRAMQRRGATRAVYVVEGRAALAKEIGEWSEGTVECGGWVATTVEHLVTAVRFCIALERLEQVRSSERTVDAESLLAQASRIRDSLKKITNIKTKATDIHTAANAIADEADRLRSDVNDALRVIEEAVAVVAESAAAVA